MNYAYVHPKDNEIYWSPVPKPEKKHEPEVCTVDCEGKCGDVCPNILQAKWDNEHYERVHQSALKAFEDGLTVKYEDQELAKRLMRMKLTGAEGNWVICELKPGTCVPIEIEGEVVEQVRRADLVPCAIWQDGTWHTGKENMPSNYEYRKVFRITK